MSLFSSFVDITRILFFIMIYQQYYCVTHVIEVMVRLETSLGRQNVTLKETFSYPT